jgi:hypothetical protein
MNINNSFRLSDIRLDVSYNNNNNNNNNRYCNNSSIRSSDLLKTMP